MASRNLTDVFTLMRNNAAQSRHFYTEQRITDRASLVEYGSHRTEVEIGLPPLWTDQLEECQYALTRLDTKIKELDNLHRRNLQRPQTFSDDSDDNHQIDVLTKEISRMFFNCHKLVDSIKLQSVGGSAVEKRLAYNAMSSLVSTLQTASNAFKDTQSRYMKTLSSREEQAAKYMQDLDTGQGDFEFDQIDLAFAHGSHQQLLMLEEENTRAAQEREAEVNKIVQSISDLNHIFKDLAHMISEQGTVLDRIDYNLERSSVQIHAGFEQLQKAARYQQGSKKMKCIIGLAVATTIMFILLVAFKFN